ncbi:ABC transporter permease/M1 family aminopeptidase [Blastomonas fulva]|uniref:ABC transporter permease/M1 family aminopeptidase n=1 Tax=Blastomonas fulva TaxID=1550728 RepID=UPI0025A4AF99|nr:M1 family aminopeptidase [Blastomonas fulva]MDM7928799.1 M1 family aminopeptidase [Blastomonas fulva]MDM7964585.1 M1 family aminopeptidase [Blastomonas fulva]
MFGTIARFELRYQFRNPVFWVATVLFFLLTFGATTVESIRLGSGGNIFTNAPTAIAQIMLTMSLFFMFVTTAFVANVVVRDDETGFGGIIRSTKVNKLSYMLGRFSGAFLGAAVAFLAVPAAIWIGTWMPWVDPELIGPNRLQDYAFAFLVIALPNLLITSAIFFAVAIWTRSVTYSYLAVIVCMFAYFALTAMLRKWPDVSLAAYFEPFGTIAYGLGVRYLTPIQANTQSLELTWMLLSHRLVWMALSIALVIIAVWRFRFAERGTSPRAARRQAAREAKLAAVRPLVVRQLPDSMPERGVWHQLRTRTLLEMKLVFKSPAFWVLALVGSINLLLTLTLAGRFYDVPPWPRTFVLVETVRGASALITVLMAIYFAGEVVWRERERRINEIIDATAVPNWVFLVSKLCGVAGVLIALSVGVVLVQSIAFQLVRGVADIELGQWLAWFAAPNIFYVIHLSVLSIVAQAVSPNKFVGWGIMLLYLVSTIVFAGLGLSHPLLNYAEASNPLSDMNGDDYGGATAWALRFYWTAFAAILVIIGHLMWRRGTAVTLAGQWRTLPARLRGMPLAIMALALAITAGMGSYLYYNMNIANHYWAGGDAEDMRTARYEKAYARYLGRPEPTLTDVRLDVELRPSRRWAQFDGRYRFTNATTRPIELLHVRIPAPTLRVEAIHVPGATLVSDDKENLHRIYRFAKPLQPGDQGTLTFRTVQEKRGLYALPSNLQAYEFDAQPAANGAYLTNFAFAPALGMSGANFLQGNKQRRKYGLPAGKTAPRLGDPAARNRNFASVDRVNTDITVTTDADQTLVVTGARVSETVANGRRTARFVSPIPSLNFITIQAGRYAQKSIDAGRGVRASVYYHPEHAMNIDRMLNAMVDSLNYYRDNFGPYQYGYARIIERPDYGGGANSAPGTVGYSEKVGFIMDFRDPNRLDFLAYLTAHELAHQYWFHQVMPADMQGAEVLTETLAQYSALMVMKKNLGADQIRQFLKYEQDIYLQGRRLEAAEEQPLAKVYRQGYIHYNKGSLVMYLLQDRLGEDRVNGVLRSLIERYRSKPAPFASSSDLVDGLLAIARTPAQRELVRDLFYRITLYDLRVSQATVRKMPDGRYETLITVAAGKSYADGKGNEREATFNEQLDIGVFRANPDDRGFTREKVISLQRLPIRSGEQTIRMITTSKPAYAGIDPYLTFVDRNVSDNVVAVTERGR